MKYFTFLILIIVIFSCKTIPVIEVTQCPEDGICTATLSKNSFLNIKTINKDEKYLSVESGDNLVFKFSYTKNQEKGTFDGQYVEDIYLEFSPETTELQLLNNELQKVNALYNKQCFCKGESGLKSISTGEVYIKKVAESTYNIQLEFKLDETSHSIKKLNETLIIK